MSDKFKFGSTVYLPPPTVGHPRSFLTNMRNFPPKHPLYVYSDHDYSSEWKGAIKLGASPEIAKCPTNKLAMQNLIFFMGIRIAAMQGLTHMMALEADCRVNRAGFDDEIWQEFMAKNVNAILCGSVAIFNPCSYSRLGAERFERFIADTRGTRLVPFSVTGSSNLAERRDTCVFPNGAFCIYNIGWMIKTYPQITDPKENCVELSQKATAWDYQCGIDLWKQFKEGVYDKIISCDKIYSGYGDILSTEEERKQWLIDEKVVGVHQIKSDWIGPEPKQLMPFVAPSVNEKPINMEIFMVTYAKDFVWLKFFLKSMRKFCSGFSGLTILVPTQDVRELREVILPFTDGEFPIRVKSGYEWRGRGFLWHEAQICHAETWCPKADFICHADPDIIFTKPTTPRTFFKAEKPLLRYEPFATLALRHPGTLNWKIAAENALPFPVSDEFMRGHCHCHPRHVYPKVREMVEQKTKLPFDEYVKSCKNSFPQSFAEHPTIGAVAYECFKNDYTLCDLSKEPNPDRSPFPVTQFWSHGPIDQPQEIWIDGLKRNVVPIQIIKETLGV